MIAGCGRHGARSSTDWRPALSLSAEDALAAVVHVANSFKSTWDHFPAQVRVGLDISTALLRDGAASGRIMLYPNNHDSWVLVVADPALAGPVVEVDGPQSGHAHQRCKFIHCHKRGEWRCKAAERHRWTNQVRPKAAGTTCGLLRRRYRRLFHAAFT
jgi:hypothetical protein